VAQQDPSDDPGLCNPWLIAVAGIFTFMGFRACRRACERSQTSDCRWCALLWLLLILEFLWGFGCYVQGRGVTARAVGN
jgi:hypothetical protein